MTRRFALLMLAALLLAIVPVSLAANAVVGTGTAGSCTAAAVQSAAAAVNAGGGTLSFNCGAMPHTITLTQQIRFDGTGATYVIDGGGLITLDGGGATRLIYTASGRNINLTVRNISLVNGYANGEPSGERAQNQGGAIYSGYRNTLTVQFVTFDNNRARAQYHEYHGGGAIAIDTTSVATITDSVFTNNTAPNGGAINNLLSRLTIERTRFVGNSATRNQPGGGGAIYNDAGKLVIRDTHILNNTSANLGGGIFSWAHDINGSYSGTSANLGGGIFSWAHDINGSYSGKTVITNTVIDGNTAASGGGLWKGGRYVLELKNSSVTNNRAQRGAGLSGTGPGKNFKIVNSTIAYNSLTAEGSAAGISSANAGSTIKNSTIAFNTMPSGSNSVSVGAAIHGTVKLTNTIILGNTGGWNGIWSCMGNIQNGGRNLQHPGNTCGSGIPTKNAQLETTLMPPLGSLALGQTQTLMPLPSSPAINKAAKCPAKDQRGVPRPQGKKCDIGAVEREGTPPPLPLIVQPLDGATNVQRNPVIEFTAPSAKKIQLIITKPNGKVVQKLKIKGDVNCTVNCSYSSSGSNISLKFNKPYRLIVKAVNNYGSSSAQISFRVMPKN